MPVYNAAASVERAARSILDGSFRDLELIVVDDGSTDDSPNIIAAIDDPRVRLFRRPREGVVAAVNFAINQSDAPLMARMDADDVSRPTRIEEQIAFMEESGCDIAGCRVRIVDESGGAVSSMQRYETWVNEHLSHESMAAYRFVEMPVVNPTLLGKREVFDLGVRHGEFPEDYDWVLRAFAADFTFGKVDEVLYDWTERADRQTRTDARYSMAAFDHCRRMHLLDGPLRDFANLPGVDLWGVGQTGKPWLRWLLENSIDVRRAYDIDLRKIGENIHGVAVQHPDELVDADGTPLIVAVGAAGARELIRPHVESRGFVVGKDAWFVA